jgi:hypothetical protein
VARARTEKGGIDLRKLPHIVIKRLGPKNHGLSSHPAFAELTPVDHPVLEVDSESEGLKRLEIFIHEAWHIAVPATPEEPVRYGARYIAKVLWAAGYRADEDWQEEHFGDVAKK